MKFGNIGVSEPLEFLNAEFDYIHVNGKSMVGSLTKECTVHILADRLRNFVENEVLGQYGNGQFERHQHRWSKPHITLAKA
jgi:hypothetical protein